MYLQQSFEPTPHLLLFALNMKQFILGQNSQSSRRSGADPNNKDNQIVLEFCSFILEKYDETTGLSQANLPAGSFAQNEVEAFQRRK